MQFEIAEVTLVPGIAGYWIQDQPAVQTGAKRDGFFFADKPLSPAFREVREPAYSYCVLLRLGDGEIVTGDCVTVVDIAYADRPLPLRHENIPAVEKLLKKLFERKIFSSFRTAAAVLEEPAAPGIALPVAYGFSQALLAAAAHASGTTMTEVIQSEFNRPKATAVPGFATVCEGDPRTNVDKVIARRVAMFPHCGIQRKEEVDSLPEYVTWMLGRIRKYGGEGYKPDLHIDFHSMLGRLLDNDMDAVCDFLGRISDLASPYQVYFEDPLLAASGSEARENMQKLRRRFDSGGLGCRLIADEWANSPGRVAEFAADQAAHAIQIKMPDNGNLLSTIEAVQACQRHGVLDYLGGSVNETDISARVSTHVGLALGVWRMLAKPGKGLDEGLMIMTNELARTCACLGIPGPYTPSAH